MPTGELREVYYLLLGNILSSHNILPLMIEFYVPVPEDLVYTTLIQGVASWFKSITIDPGEPDATGVDGSEIATQLPGVTTFPLSS